MYPIIHNDEKWSTYFIIHHNAWKVKFVLQHFRCTLPSKVIQIINFFWKMFVSVSTKYYLRKIVICIIFVSHSVRKIRYWSCNRSWMNFLQKRLEITVRFLYIHNHSVILLRRFVSCMMVIHVIKSGNLSKAFILF